MYAPTPFFSDDINITADLVETIVMGTLVTSGSDTASAPSLQGSPLPFMIEKNDDGTAKLISHMDRRNPLWREMEDGREVLVIFWGPSAYISPSIYTTTPRVPTWIYTTAHVSGMPRLVHDGDAKDKIVSDLCRFMEKPDSGWDISQVGDYKARLLDAIVGFEIDITSAQSQVRLGQLNNSEDLKAVYEALSHGAPGDMQVAEIMKNMGIVEL
ncbi:MAG: FMN-binding negative transcriptional regulator [Emcibacter sp.]|nr:FMN-binding negative transcriptional regulator [Emcibacter sp.]